MNNDRYFGKADPLLDISLCPLCAGSRCADCAMLVFAGRDAGAETVFLHRRRTFPCGVWRNGDCRRAANHK